ncbi:hypothetical protein [Rouxiella chamberiensis]|uniref:Uncharacterized protein n=1 Tax=Rouxiella chamberiensis TaxID=1513468 RepID=A0ABY7HUH3_9GAMM|nr:hypothetical protein [Rouxiella chamberiensis]WAT02627.1 hypothetical protein O1V66_08790 [Rouxiella chamberiensis]
MYNFQRYHAKELALAYMSGKTHNYTPEEFLEQLKKTEQRFDGLLRHGHDVTRGLVSKAF